MQPILMNFMHIVWIIPIVLDHTNFHRFHNFCSISQRLMLAKYLHAKISMPKVLYHYIYFISICIYYCRQYMLIYFVQEKYFIVGGCKSK